MLGENGKSDASSESYVVQHQILLRLFSFLFLWIDFQTLQKKLNQNQYVSPKFLIHRISKQQQKHIFRELSNTLNYHLVFQQGSFTVGTAKGKILV